MNQDLHEYFIGYNKDFDKFRHETLIEMLVSKKGIHLRDLRIFSNEYYGQKIAIRVEDISEEIRIQRSVHRR